MLNQIKKCWHFFTCERYTELASQELDQKLCGLDRWGFLFHHAICTFCRRSRRQLKVIEKASLKLDLEGSLGANESQGLSEAAKQRIKQSLH
ncbi:MAG: hypothetical protein KDD62_00845 [Bdellovibrionales bacterium]|nr:hypothetical protein [Bdellovibrionales bacterium]